MHVGARMPVVALALATLACSTVESQPTGRHWPAWLHQCSIDGVVDSAHCGRVRVDESGDEPPRRSIDLNVVVLPALGRTPSPDPLLPLVGGPGQGAADLAPILVQRFAAYREWRDLVLIDQRGTGKSNGLHCARAKRASDLMGKIFDPVRLAECRDELSSRADLTQYTTAAAARDYEKVLDALEYRQVNLVGVSYGSRMALEIARRLPARVRTVTIESVVPTSFDWPSQGAADADAALKAVVEDCAAERGCAEAFPTFRADIDAAFARLARRPITVAVRDPATGGSEHVPFAVTDLAYATRGLLYGNEALSLPLFFRRAAEGVFEPFAQAYVARARNLEAQIAGGVHLSVYCAEDLPYVDEARARQTAEGTRLGDYLIEQYRRACEVWPRARIPSGFREPIRSEIPTLLMSGRRDPVTPPRTAEDAARTLPRSKVVVWKYGGHGTDGLLTADCRLTIVQHFLSTADATRLPVDCAMNQPALSFRLRAPAP